MKEIVYVQLVLLVFNVKLQLKFVLVVAMEMEFVIKLVNNVIVTMDSVVQIAVLRVV